MVIVVEIEDRCVEKPFLGGWRNVVTGAEYHDACTQTCPGERVYRGSNEDSGLGYVVDGFIRTANVITQTQGNGNAGVTSVGVSASRCKYTSVSTGRGTQTSRLPDLGDKLVTPLAVTGIRNNATRRSHCREVSLARFTATQRTSCRGSRDTTDDDENHFSRLLHESAVKIQKCYRAYRARLKIGALAKLSRETRAQTPPKPSQIRHSRHRPAIRFDIINPSPPNRRSDFEMVENVLGRWRVHENDRIDRNFFGTSKIAARTTVLLREIEILRSIETIKTRIRVDRRQRRYLDRLDDLARPEIWNVSGEKKIYVETLRVQRAREFRDFYETLIREDTTTKCRIEALKNLKRHAIRHTCRYARDLSSLIDQELELIARSVDPRSLISLRNRLKLALLRLSLNFSDSEKRSNARNNRESIVEIGIDGVRGICNRCEKIFKRDDVPIFGITRGIVSCPNCRNRQTSKDPKIVYEPYEIMLRELRSREISLSSERETELSRGPAFAVDTRVIYRLVNYVWHGKSGISECDDLFRLVLVRFRAELAWSPWNNLVLTKREAALHRAMTDPWLIYSSGLVKKFVVRNLQAKLRFPIPKRYKFYS